ncbi:hypothetical protein [Clostridium oceanicum]|uniref:DUF1540 domain-containing protein n=1 Tax=Clostridium oceanicum TaxID=1543 RepID=A0ABP3UER5_9CLOT
MENMDKKVIMNREEEAMASCCDHHGSNCGKIDITCNNVNIYVSCGD